MKRARYSAVGFPLTLGLRALVTFSLAPLRDLRAVHGIARSDLFSRDWYFRRYPDVAALGIDPIRHYVSFGAREGRDPGPDFSTRGYLACNPDVAAVGVNPLAHFIRYGRREGRTVDKYQRWIAQREPQAMAQMRTALQVTAAERPSLSILLTVCDPPVRYLVKAINSVRAQTATNSQLCIADDASTNAEVREVLASAAEQPNVKLTLREQRGGISAATNSAFALADSPFITCLDHDDVLARQAIEICSGALARAPETALLYTDEDKIDEAGRRFDVYFKPDYSPDLFYSCNYFNHLTLHRTDVVRRLGGWRSSCDGAQDYDLLLRALEIIDHHRIVHLPLVLYHWRAIAGSTAGNLAAKNYAIDAGRRALAEHFHRRRIAATVSVVPPMGYRIRYDLPDPPPRVSIIIPFRDRAELLKRCVDSLRERTQYSDLEILLIDNGSERSETQDLLESYRRSNNVSIISAPGPFNFSALNNLAVARATGEYICLLNNDTEVISPDWLTDMVGYASQQGAGCVGAKLLYDNDTIQHAGVVIGIGGVAGHVFTSEPPTADGYFGRLRLASNYSAVTGACLLVRRDIYQEVGGLDQSELPVAFNDVDFCLKVRNRGYRNIITPFAQLYHLESASRGYEDTLKKKKRFESEIHVMFRRYGASLKQDPCYSPHLTLHGDDFSIAVDEEDRLLIQHIKVEKRDVAIL